MPVAATAAEKALYPWLTEDWNPTAGAPSPQPAQAPWVPPPPGIPGVGSGGLPGMVANNPQAYVNLLKAGQFDPLAVGEQIYGWRPKLVHGTSRVSLIDPGDRQKAALAAVAAQYANDRRMERLLASLENRDPNPGILGQALGGLGGMIGDRQVAGPRTVGPHSLPPGAHGAPAPITQDKNGWLGALGNILQSLGGSGYL